MCRMYVELFPEGDDAAVAAELLPVAEEKLAEAKEAEKALAEDLD